MVLETLLTTLAIITLVASGIVTLPWTSFELRGSALAYHTLARLTRAGLSIVVAPVRALTALDFGSARAVVAHRAVAAAVAGHSAITDRAVLMTGTHRDASPELRSVPGYL